MTEAGYDDAVRVPYALVAVRQGATVAMISTSDRGKEAAAVPDVVVGTQLKKLGAQLTSE
ncbi:hypothetical protein [Streptomyces sp. NRRL S-646]|uniref:hypothetical protein n=1 Tax=Streptomyces sp. NRRL S-646 TaxID=1463917 RepID=UPI0004C5F86B|nr:hypothetical protein [Streptomyces sp. NRRL S-646]